MRGLDEAASPLSLVVEHAILPGAIVVMTLVEQPL